MKVPEHIDRLQCKRAVLECSGNGAIIRTLQEIEWSLLCGIFNDCVILHIAEERCTSNRLTSNVIYFVNGKHF